MKQLMCVLCVFTMTSLVSADLAQFGGVAGWMHVYENTGGTQGGYLWGSGWEPVDLQAITTDDSNFELLPNVNTYADNVGGTPDDVAYWTDSPDGGVTVGNDGNKFMEANVYREHTIGAGQTAADYSYLVSSFDLDTRYDLQAFVKILDPTDGFSTAHEDYASITGIASTNTMNVAAEHLVEGRILQIGFVMTGLNANPATDWGSAVVEITDANVVPEPATMGLALLSGGFLYTVRRLRNY